MADYLHSLSSLSSGAVVQAGCSCTPTPTSLPLLLATVSSLLSLSSQTKPLPLLLAYTFRLTYYCILSDWATRQTFSNTSERSR